MCPLTRIFLPSPSLCTFHAIIIDIYPPLGPASIIALLSPFLFQDLFVCMLRNMFEEYKFFPQFPEKELQITGQLFGGIIEHGLVT